MRAKSSKQDRDETLSARAPSAHAAPDVSSLVGRPLIRKERAGVPLEASITAEQVSNVVETFYGRIREHPRLSKLFAEEMTQEWPDHLERMKGFWRSMLMQTREYSGRPVPAHMKMEGLAPDDFAQWLALFRQTARELCPPAAAGLYIDRAETVARSLQMAVFFHGQIAPPSAFINGVMTDEAIAAYERGLSTER